MILFSDLLVLQRHELLQPRDRESERERKRETYSDSELTMKHFRYSKIAPPATTSTLGYNISSATATQLIKNKFLNKI